MHALRAIDRCGKTIQPICSKAIQHFLRVQDTFSAKLETNNISVRSVKVSKDFFAKERYLGHYVLKPHKSVTADADSIKDHSVKVSLQSLENCPRENDLKTRTSNNNITSH